jgi:type II secretory pathway component PulJ
MKHLRENKGFTLIELVVSIASASLVFAAASMLLLLCMRTQRDVYNVAKEQRTSRIVLSMLENLASDGTIRKVETTSTGWNLLSEDDQNVLTYSVVEKALILHGEELLDGIRTAHAELNGQMLTFSFGDHVFIIERHGGGSPHGKAAD